LRLPSKRGKTNWGICCDDAADCRAGLADGRDRVPVGLGATLAGGERRMTDPSDPLVLDLVEWVAREPRLYSEVIETWRTSCPRLTIWEDAVDRGYVARRPTVEGLRVTVTAHGEKFLREHRRVG